MKPLFLNVTLFAVAAFMPVSARAIGPSASRALATPDSLAGQIVDTTGKPVTGATVSVSELGIGTATSSAGSFVFPRIPSGRYTIVARRKGYQPAIRQLTVNGATGITIRLIATPFAIEPVVVTATRLPEGPMQLALPVASLSEDALRREATISLAHSLQKIPGVRSVSTGEQIGKPMIRGLVGARVAVLADGSRMEDYSWSEEDAPSLDARLAQRVEVIRGPGSVLYGSDALGGVVNVVPADLPSANGGSAFSRFDAELYGASNNKEVGTALSLEGARGSLGWRAIGVGRFAESFSTPAGELENTGFTAANGEAAIALRGKRNTTTLRVAHYGGEFKLLEARSPAAGAEPSAGEEEGGPERKLMDDRVQLTTNHVIGDWRFEGKGQFQRHALQEVSDDACLVAEVLGEPCDADTAEKKESTAFDLLLNTGTLDLLAHHALGDHFRGTFGGSGLHQTNDSKGPILLIPGASVTSGGVFGFESATYGQWTMAAGGRFDSRHVSAQLAEKLGTDSENERDWSVGSGNVGIVFRPIPALSIGANAGLGWRAPTLFELYADGPHLAEGRWEIGDANLDAERSTELDVNARWENQVARVEAALFRNRINDFIYLTPTTESIRGMAVFRHRQNDALLTGGEVAAEVSVAGGFLLHGRGDFLRGTNETLDEPLPLMPPRRFAVGASFRGTAGWFPDFHVRGEVEHVTKQDRPNPLDFVTGAYTLLNFDAGVERRLLGRTARMEIALRNAGNVRYRSFLSRYKEFALEPGRNLILRVSTTR